MWRTVALILPEIGFLQRASRHSGIIQGEGQLLIYLSRRRKTLVGLVQSLATSATKSY